MSDARNGILWNLLLPVENRDDAYILPWQTNGRSIIRHQTNRTGDGIEIYIEYDDGQKDMLYLPFSAVPDELSERTDAQHITVHPLHELDVDFDEERFQDAVQLLKSTD